MPSFNLFTRTVIAIDGSKFKAVNNRDKNFTVAKVAKRIEQVEASIARYLAALDRADREDGDVAEAKTVRLKEKIKGLRRQMQSLKEIGQQVEAAPDKQVSLTDPDARSMATSGKGTGIVGYNVQIAVDAEHHLIVAHEVTNVGSDRAQLTAMGRKAREASGCEEVTVLADRGYYNGDEVLACKGTGILPVIPKTQTSGNPKRGLFTVADFIYDAESDRYTCPAGEHLTKGKVRSDRRDNIDHYRNLTACLTCALKPRCTPDKVKRLKRWEHESVLDKMPARLDHMPEAMIIRRQTVEHPFGTLKAWMGSTHFLTRTLEKVKTRDELAGAGLQYEANDQPLRRQTADAGDRGLTARACRRELPLSRNTRIGNHVFTRPRRNSSFDKPGSGCSSNCAKRPTVKSTLNRPSIRGGGRSRLMGSREPRRLPIVLASSRRRFLQYLAGSPLCASSAISAYGVEAPSKLPESDGLGAGGQAT